MDTRNLKNKVKLCESVLLHTFGHLSIVLRILHYIWLVIPLDERTNISTYTFQNTASSSTNAINYFHKSILRPHNIHITSGNDSKLPKKCTTSILSICSHEKEEKEMKRAIHKYENALYCSVILTACSKVCALLLAIAIASTVIRAEHRRFRKCQTTRRHAFAKQLSTYAGAYPLPVHIPDDLYSLTKFRNQLRERFAFVRCLQA